MGRLNSKINKIKKGEGNVEGRYLNKYLYFWGPVTKVSDKSKIIYIFLLSLAHDGGIKNDKFGHLKKGWVFEDIEDIAVNMDIDTKNFRYKFLKQLEDNDLIKIVKTRFGDKIFVQNTDTLHHAKIPTNEQIEANKEDKEGTDFYRINKGFEFYNDDEEDEEQYQEDIKIDNIEKLTKEDIQDILEGHKMSKKFFSSTAWICSDIDTKRSWIIKLNQLMTQKKRPTKIMAVLVDLIKNGEIECHKFDKKEVEKDVEQKNNIKEDYEDNDEPLW